MNGEVDWSAELRTTLEDKSRDEVEKTLSPKSIDNVALPRPSRAESVQTSTESEYIPPDHGSNDTSDTDVQSSVFPVDED